jgi:membrane associated rhomboid family serine protease
MDYFRPPTFSLFPPVVKNLLIINGLCFVTAFVLQNSHYNIDLNNILGLHYFMSSSFHFYQIFTYMFMHGGIPHILFNMFALWMFGYSLENLWGAKKFIVFYLICGIGAGVTQEVFQYLYFQHLHKAVEVFLSTPMQTSDEFNAFLANSFGFTVPGTVSPEMFSQYAWEAYHKFMDAFVTIGASGAIFGILLAFGMIFPNTELLVYFIVPVKAKYFVIIYGLLELFFAVSNKPGDNVAHYAHLGGMVFGFILLMYWRVQRKR